MNETASRCLGMLSGLVLMLCAATAQAQTAAPSPASGAAPASAAAPAPTDPKPEYLSVEQLRAKYADRHSKYTTIKGVEIHYKDEGKGPVLLLVHGSQSSLRIWDHTAAALKSRYRVIRFDVAGMGLSGRVSDEAAANATPLDIVLGLLAQLKVDKLTFVGNSSGGTLGMFLAAQHPEMVERLILTNVPADIVRYGHMVQPQSFIDAQAEMKRLGGFQSRHFWDEFLNYFSGKGERISAQKRDEYYDFNRREPEKHPIALIAQIGDGVEANKLMAAVTTPTLLIWGTKDQLLPFAAMQSMERHLEKAPVSRVIMPDVGHYPPLEVPERITQLIAAYVEAGVPIVGP